MAAAAQRMTGDQIIDTFIGNSLSGRTKSGESVTEFYSGDGSIKGALNGQGYAATWWVDGDRACFDYDRDEQDGCYGIAAIGDRVFYYQNGEWTGRSYTLVTGNPQNL
jgi:hypothetical protein